MKKNYVILCIFLISKVGFSQAPSPLLWGGSPFQDSLWAFDTTSWAPSVNVPALVTGSTVTGINGMAFDPTTYKSYAILKMNSSRYLAEVSLPSGSCTVMGDLGDNFSSITFDKFGQLYGATGDGANVPESFYKINKANATNTLVFAMGNGIDGEVICYNRFDNKIYHWSGNGTVICESFPVGSTSYTPANISISGTNGGETFGAICLKPNDFIISSISSDFRHESSTGFFGSAVNANSLPDDIRGVIMPPRFGITSSTLCISHPTLGIYSGCLQQFDSVYYYWGDGNVTQLLATSAATAASTHSYSALGNYTVTVKLYNGAVAKSTFQTFTLTVSTSPTVSISGNAFVCPGITATLTGSSGGSSQWYSSGVAIPGATLSTYTTTTAGWYNMIKTNLNGCADSASTGFQVSVAPAPTVAASGDTIICSGSSATITPSGANTYTITGGSTVVSPTVTTSYSVTGTASTGCVAGNTAVVTITVNAAPSVTITSTGSLVCAGQPATLTATGASLYAWSTTQNTNVIVVNPTVTTSYTATGTNSVNCSGSAVATISVNPLPSLSVTTTNTMICKGESATLTASGASVYAWNTSQNTNSITVSPTVTTTYTITGTSALGCVNTTTVSQDVSDCDGIQKNSEPAVSVRVIPNPSTGKFTVENIADNAQVEVHNGLGQLIVKANAQAGNAQIDLSAYSAGIYVVTVNQDQKIIAQIKVIKQ